MEKTRIETHQLSRKNKPTMKEMKLKVTPPRDATDCIASHSRKSFFRNPCSQIEYKDIYFRTPYSAGCSIIAGAVNYLFSLSPHHIQGVRTFLRMDSIFPKL